MRAGIRTCVRMLLYVHTCARACVCGHAILHTELQLMRLLLVHFGCHGSRWPYISLPGSADVAQAGVQYEQSKRVVFNQMVQCFFFFKP